MLAVLCVLALSTFTYSGEGDKKILVVAESNEDVIFEVSSKFDKNLFIHVEGVQDEFASLSLIDRRGKSIIYKFLQKGTYDYELDLSSLEKGIYYVKLNFEGEIRMKTLVID